MWKRIALYGAGATAAAALLWAGYVFEPLPSMEVGLDRALTMIREKDHDAALKLALRLEEGWPEDVRGPHLVAWCLDLKGRLDEAQERYRASLPLCEDDALRRHVLLCIADLEHRKGNDDKARELVADAVDRYGASRRSIWLNAQLQSARGSDGGSVKSAPTNAEERAGN